jgi:hypothetical protein
MNRFSFQESEAHGDSPVLGRVEQILVIVVRSVGLILLLVGLFVALGVIGEAWALYEDPRPIEKLAAAIERDSMLDAALAPRRPASEAADPALPGSLAEERTPAFRLSYFVAWAIALLLLMLVGRLSIAAVKTGGELALYDLQLRQLGRRLMRPHRDAD